VCFQEPDQLPPEETADVTALALLSSGAAVRFDIQGMDGDKVLGTHAILGPCRMPLEEILDLQVGNVSRKQAPIPFADWKLIPAPEPAFAGGDPTGAAIGTDSPLVGTSPANFLLPQLESGQFRLDEHQGKIVILDFWATWCGPCVASLPRLMEAAAAYPDDQVVLIAINQQEHADTIREFLEARKWKLNVALDRTGKIGRQFGVTAIPQTVVLGKDGKVARLYVGASTDAHENLVQFLAEQFPTENAGGAAVLNDE
jgi:thiol-disulfide isomerase/thioredoxin